MLNLWPLLLPAAAWSGWVVAMRRDKSRQQTVSNRLSKEYVVGLNYLLNEQPDEAVDVFQFLVGKSEIRLSNRHQFLSAARGLPDPEG